MWTFMAGYAVGMAATIVILVGLWLLEDAAERRERVYEDGPYG